ncbi:MAG TPA: hypothetical protein VM260_02830 [Pirellula sp.]|nr:hypothetical protein [Pirellula sp.]
MDITAPEPEKGHLAYSGVYFRNLTKDDVAPHYKDRDVGVRLKIGTVKQWDWLENGRIALSVNESMCCGCDPKTSIRLCYDAKNYCHVWQIDLQLLNRYIGQHANSDQLVAKYDPLKKPQDPNDNACHFLLCSFNGVLTVNEMIFVFEQLDDVIPPKANHPKKFPKADAEQAIAATEQYAQVVRIHRDVV